MKALFTLISAASLVVLNAGYVFAQRNDEAEACAGCGICGGSIAVMVIIPLVVVVLNIALLVWVARDAKSRGMDSAVLWMILVMLTGLLGLLIYIFSRPQGNVMPCPSCGNNRLQASARCPHCGNA